MLEIVIIGALLCVGLFAWAGVLNKISYWMYTTPLNAKLSPRWYAKNREKIEAIRARGHV